MDYFNLMNTALFQIIFESSVEGILVVDDKGTIVKVNAAAENIFGYCKGELHNKEIESLLPKRYRKIHRKHREEYSKEPTSRPAGKATNLWGLKKDGTVFPMDISLSPITVDSQQLIITFLRDISEKRTVDKAFAENERRLRTLIGNLPGFVYRAKNSEDWPAEFVSEGVLSITGYKPNDFMEGRMNFGQLIIEKDKKYVRDTIQKSLYVKKPYSLQYRIITKNGELKYLWGQGVGILDREGHITAIEGFIQDISGNVLLERTIKRKEAKNRALLEALPDTMYIMDAQGNYLDFYTPEPEKLLVSADELVGKNIKEVLPLAVYRKIKTALQDTFEEKRNNSIEYEVKMKNKRYFYEARLVPLNNHSVLSIVRDVTDRKNMERTLKIRTRALAAAGNGILIVDAKKTDYPIIYVNDAFTKITGFKRSEVMGKNCRFLQCDDRDQEEIRIMKKAVEEGSPCEVVLRNYKKDGTVFYNEITITPVYNEQQKLTHFIGVQNDVTERVLEDMRKTRMREALEMIAQEEQLDLVANNLIKVAENHIEDSIGSVFLIDKGKKTIHRLAGPNLPESFEKVLEGEKINAKLCPCAATAFYKKEIIVPDLAKNTEWRDNRFLALQEGLKSSWSFPIFSSAKEVLGVFSIYCKKSKKPSKVEKSLIYNIINLLNIALEQETTRRELTTSRKKLAAYAQDLEKEVEKRTGELMATLQELVETNLNLKDQIIETKAAEHQAKTNEALFSAIAKNFPKGAIAVVDKDYRLIFADGDELNNFGITAREIEHLAIDDIAILNKDQKNFIKESIKRTLAGEHLSFEVKFRGHVYAVNTTPLTDVDEQINRALFVYNNISEHKLVELEILNALRKEQELNELKSRFVSMASHEFRTPLSTILSSATLIERQNEPGKEEKRINYVARIKSNVRNMVKVLNDFLSLSKLEEGNLAIQPEKFDLAPFLENIVEEVGMNKKDGQSINLEIKGEKTVIHQDPKAVRLIVNNLMSNAIKYSPENTTIVIVLKIKNDTVYLQVTDRGIGVPREDQKNLFERFFRSQNASHIQGTGLGLYLVKQYVNLINGTISFKSSEGRGTTFYVEFPTKY